MFRRIVARAVQPETTANCEFCVERLEDRKLLAGVVNVVHKPNGDLILTGNAESNTVALLATANGPLAITGTGTQFKFNGTTAPSHQILPVVTQDSLHRIRVNLKDGDDSFVLSQFDTSPVTGTSIRANLGSGNDRFVMQINASFNGDIRVAAGSGNDELRIAGVTVVGNVTFLSGAGGDEATADDMLVSAAMVNGDLTMRGAGGVDWARVLSSDIQGQTSVSTGAGDDQVVHSLSSFQDRTQIATGGGNDRLTLTGIMANADYAARLGGGDDTIVGANSSSIFEQDLVFNGNGGNDGTLGVQPTVSGLFDMISIEDVNW